MIYLDHHAATPLDARAARAMAEAHEIAWANPASPHRAGQAARRLVETAREQVAGAVGAQAADLVFTSGGTEACNLGVLGLAAGKRRVVCLAVEHPAVLRAAEAAAREHGAGLSLVDVLGGVPPEPTAIAAEAGPDVLMCLQWVNHETGLLFPVAAYAEAAKAAGATVFIDACQALGKVPVDVGALAADAVALAAHKAGGPAGAGALWLARCVAAEPQMLGGGQERGRRAGSPDVAALAGFGAAAGAVGARLAGMDRVGRLRDSLEAALVSLGAVRTLPEPTPRVATAAHVSVPGWSGPALVAALDVEGVAVAAGPACSSGVAEPSAVVRAMFLAEPWRATSALRVSLGIETTDDAAREAALVFGRVLPRANLERA